MDNEMVGLSLDKAMEGRGLDKIRHDVLVVERVFLQWIEDPDASVNVLADRSAVDPKLVRRLLRSGEFQRRYMEETAQFREVAESYTRGRVHELMDRSISRLADIIDNGADKDAVGAVRALSALIPAQRVEVAEQTNYIDARTIELAAGGLKNMSDITKMLNAQTDANIAQVEEERSTKGGQR